MCPLRGQSLESRLAAQRSVQQPLGPRSLRQIRDDEAQTTLPLEVKAFFLVGCAVFAIMVLFLTRGDRGARDAWFWRGGTEDLARRALLRPDGTFRKHSKMVWLAWIVVFALIVWFLPGTK